MNKTLIPGRTTFILWFSDYFLSHRSSVYKVQLVYDTYTTSVTHVHGWWTCRNLLPRTLWVSSAVSQVDFHFTLHLNVYRTSNLHERPGVWLVSRLSPSERPNFINLCWRLVRNRVFIRYVCLPTRNLSVRIWCCSFLYIESLLYSHRRITVSCMNCLNENVILHIFYFTNHSWDFSLSRIHLTPSSRLKLPGTWTTTWTLRKKGGRKDLSLSWSSSRDQDWVLYSSSWTLRGSLIPWVEGEGWDGG